MKKCIRRWMKKIGCTVLATAVMVCTIPNQVYVYPGQMVRAEETILEETSAVSEGEESSSNTIEIATLSEKSSTPESSEPISSTPASSEMASTEPVSTEPASTEPTSTEPTSTEPTSTEPVTEDPSTESTSTEPVTEDPSTESTSTEPVTEDPSTESTSTEPVTEDPSTEPTSTEPVILPSIEVSLADTSISQSMPVRDHDKDAFKTTITVGASASYTKGENTTDEDAKELLKAYAIKIAVSYDGEADSVMEIPYDSLAVNKSFDVYTDGEVRADISLVKKEGDSTTQQEGPVTKSVTVMLPQPEVVLTSVSADIADTYEYTKLDTGYQVEATVSAKAVYQIKNNTTESAAKELLEKYTLYITDNAGNQLGEVKLSNGSITNGADTENVTYEVVFDQYSVSFVKDNENYAINAEIKLDDTTQISDATEEVKVLIPVIEVKNSTLTIDKKDSVFEDNQYKAVLSATSTVEYSAVNATSELVTEWLKDYSFVTEVYQEFADGSTKVLKNEKQEIVVDAVNHTYVLTSTVEVKTAQDGTVYAKSYLKKNGSLEQEVNVENGIEVKIPKIALKKTKPTVTYEYSKNNHVLSAYATVSTEVSYEVVNYIDDQAMADMLAACNVKLEARTTYLGVLVNPIEEDKGKNIGAFTKSKDTYTLQYRVEILKFTKLQGKVIYTIPGMNSSEEGDNADIRIPKIHIQEPKAKLWISDYQKDEVGVYEAEVSFNGSVAFSIEDFAPENADDQTWKNASDDLLDDYRVQLVLKNKAGTEIVKTDYKSFVNADGQDYDDNSVKLNCDIALDLSQLIDADDELTAVYIIYHEDAGEWKELKTKESSVLTVGIPSVSIPEKAVTTVINPKYCYDKQKDEHSFDISIDADVVYELIRGTADQIQETIDELLADYKVRLTLYNGETLLESQDITETVFNQKDNSTAKLSYNFNTTEELADFRAVVTAWHEVSENNWEEVTLASYEPETESIVIPEDIVLTSESAPAIFVAHDESLCNHNGNNTSLVNQHELQVEGEVVLTFTGLSGLTVIQREEEIENRVAACSMTVYEQLADTSTECLTFDFAGCDYQIVATDNAECYQVVVAVDGSFETKVSGEHVYYAEVVANDGTTTYTEDTHEVMIQELPQNFAFEPKEKEVVYAQDLEFRLTQASDLYVGDFSCNCYKVTADGKVLVNEARVVGIDKNVITINTEDVGEYYIEFTFAGNDIYESTTDHTTFTVNKAPVTTAFHVSNSEFTKSQELTMGVTMDVVNPAALKRYMAEHDIVVSFEAVPDNKQYATVLLAEEEILFDDDAQKAMVTVEIPHSVSKKLVQETTYTVRAEIQCGEAFPYTNDKVSAVDEGNIVLTSEGFKVNNLDLVMSNDGVVMTHELSHESEYKAAVPTYDLGLSFYEVQNNNKPVQEPIKVTYTSSDESIATVTDQGIVSIKTAGIVYISVVADDASEDQNVYNTFNGQFKLEILSPADTRVELSVNGTTTEYANVQEIYNARDAFVTRMGEGVYWYDEDIVITIPEGSEYNKICYSVNGGAEQTTEGNTLVIDNELFADYQFHLIHDTAKLNSLDASADNGVHKELNHVAIDKNAPAVEDIIKLTSDVVKSEYSSEILEYYSAKVQLTINDDDHQETEKVFDYQSGVKSIEVQYGKDGKYEPSKNQDVIYADNACYFDTFTFDFDEINYNYNTVKVIVTDNMNHETEVVFRGTVAGTDQKNAPNYEGTKAVQICVDTNEPDLVVVGQNADTDRLEKAYEGEWTDEQVNYSLSVADLDQVVSGIQVYQYAVLAKEDAPEGDVDLATLAWKEIPVEKLEVLFGIVEGEYDETIKEGSFIYTSANGEEMLERNEEKDADTEDTKEPEEYKLNGTVYFRAISNSGLIGNVNKEIKIWQTEMDAPNVYANNKPAETGWYNKQTGTVTLRFEYPDDYMLDQNAPAVGLSYQFEKKEENGQTKTTNPEPFMITDVKLADGKYVGEATIEIPTDSMNILTIHNLDEAGNKSEVYRYTLDADYNAPEIKSISYNGKSQELYEEGSREEVVYNVFTQSSISVSTNVTYGISQKQSLKLQQCKNIGDGNGGTEAESVTISPNARGFIYATATDVAGNKTVAWATGYVADNRKPNDSKGVEITAPAANAEDFYHDDVPLKISVSDTNGDDHAGLKSVTYSITADGKTTKSGESLLSFPTSTPTWSQIKQYETLSTEEVVIDAASNEGNEVVVRVTAVDNAQNETITEKTYMIDITKPVIDVTFDTDAAVNGTYYNKARTARIEITERNFDPSKVKFVMYKDGVENNSLVPSNWSTNEMTHIATITFAEDGDYSFTVECTDMADNEAEQVIVDEFTVDVTNPVVEVAYDQDTPWSENYFNTARTATITVTEHNFNAADFTTIVEPHVALSNWTHNGDTHRATLSFTQDSHYTLNMSYTDMAGNAMEPFAMQDFYIDTQVPEISLSGVEDHSANAGTVIPVITTADTNYDTDGLQITLTDSTGAAYIVERVVSVLPNGYQYTLSNVDGLGDQIYTLSAVLTDKAGNSSEISCRFSLNRNGSTYDLQEISQLVETKYLRYADMEDLHVTEMNVDKIENFSVYMNKAGEVLTKSQAGPLPSKLEADIIYYDVEVLGNDETGYEYVYTLYRENFESEGIYNLMFYSKDRAGNEVNNTLTEKGAEITFVVDNTAPTVVIDGIEGGEFYAEEYRDVNVYVSDYTQLVEAFFYLVDEDGVTVETYNYLELAEHAGDVVTIRIPSNDKSLHLDYSAKDIAGNEITSITISDEATPTSFMITTNKWLQLRNNETALTAIIIGGTVVIVLIPVTTIYFKRRRNGKV